MDHYRGSRLRWCKTLRTARRLLLMMLAWLWLTGLAQLDADEPFFFMQLTDPQFGMYTKNANFEQETANFEFAIATANRLNPAFVIVTGDLLNKPGDVAQADEYLRIVAKLNRSIRWYQLPGNHDVGNDPTPESIAAYTAKFGPDHYSFRQGSLIGVVLNSNLICSPKGAPKQAEEQKAWLKSELEKAREQKVRHVVVFQHHSWFIKSADEPNQYFNVPREQRATYLDLLRRHGVSHVFAGHYHGNEIARDDSLEMVTTGPIGKPLRQNQSGLRIVIVRDDGIEHQYYTLGEVPNQIDLLPAKKGTSRVTSDVGK